LLVRITWILVVAALGTLIGGFFTPDSNVLLFVAIGLALSVIVVVVVSWARRAREAPSYGFEEGLALTEEEEEVPDEELFAALERDEEFAVGGRRRSRRPRRRPAPRTPQARPSKPKAKPKAKAARKAKPKATGAAKPKSTRKAKPKAGGRKATRPKAKPPRRRPPAE
jgi:hypothetical protein